MNKKPDTRFLNSSEFLKYYWEDIKIEYYWEDIKKGKLSRDELDYAIDLMGMIRGFDQICLEKYVMNIYYFMLKYRYFPEDQCELYITLIRESYSYLEICCNHCSDTLLKRIDCEKIYNLVVTRIQLENKFDIQDKEFPEEFNIENLNEEFIEPYLDKYSINRSKPQSI